jgi:hypothetical protein
MDDMAEDTATRIVTAAMMGLSLAVSAAMFLLLFRAWGIDPLIGEVVLSLGVLAGGAVITALLRAPLTTVIFHPGVASRASTHAAVRRQTRAQRWVAPAAGVATLLLLFVFYRAAVLSVSVAYYAMAALSLGSILIGVIRRDTTDEDRRADLPIAMVVSWGVLYLLKIGIGVRILALLAWFAFAIEIPYVLTREHSRWWIAIGFAVTALLTLYAMFAR